VFITYDNKHQDAVMRFQVLECLHGSGRCANIGSKILQKSECYHDSEHIHKSTQRHNP
jgi:hypothetical protein